MTVTGDARLHDELARRSKPPPHRNAALIVLIWNDDCYGLIEWHQLRRFKRTSNVRFGNPDFVKFAESFGAKGYRVSAADELVPIIKQAIADNTVVVIDCPVDYSENMKLTRKAWTTGMPGVGPACRAGLRRTGFQPVKKTTCSHGSGVGTQFRFCSGVAESPGEVAR